LLDDALLYLRSCENLTAPAIENVAGDDRVASIETCASIDCDRLLDDAPQVRVLQVREVFTSPMPPPLALQRPHPNIEGLIAFRPVTAQAIAMLPGLRFLKVHRSFPQLGPAVSPEVQLALPPGLEEIWDRLLSSGRLMYGVAVDDAHHFKRPGDPLASGPGRGWIYVRAEQLEGRALVEAMERGDFYASTGVELAAYEGTATGMTLTVKATTYSKYRVQFIGRTGKVLSEQTTPAASYTFKGDEGYVRARVLESNGYMAWTQPVPVGPGGPKVSQ